MATEITAPITLSPVAITAPITVSSVTITAPVTLGYVGPPGTTDYNELDNVPATFAPSAHTHVSSDIVSVTSERLIGRHAGGSGAAQEVQVGDGIEFSGGAIQRSALTGDITAAAGSNSTTLAATIAGAKTFSGQLELTGQAATTADSAMTRGLADVRYHTAITKFKDVDESRTETTDFVADSDLVVDIPTTGLWLISVYVIGIAASNTSGFRLRLAISLTANLTKSAFIGGDTSNFSTGSLRNLVRPDSGGNPFPRLIVQNNNKFYATKIDFVFRVTAIGNFRCEWGQNTSSADASVIKAGSHLIARRIAD